MPDQLPPWDIEGVRRREEIRREAIAAVKRSMDRTRRTRRRLFESEAIDRVRELVERVAPGPRRARQGDPDDTLARWSESWG